VIISFLWLMLGLNAMAAAPVDYSGEDMGAMLAEPPLEDVPSTQVGNARTDRLQTALRCPVCQGLSVSDSPSDAARAMGDRIEELVRLGYTEDQVTEYFVDRYGPWVELEPPAEGQHLIIFVAPAAIVLLGFLMAGVAWRKRTPVMAREAAYTPDPSLAPYRERVIAMLEGEAP
jgi:cytochrome c-type biogenesis protein CcmH/NrfF